MGKEKETKEKGLKWKTAFVCPLCEELFRNGEYVVANRGYAVHEKCVRPVKRRKEVH